MENYVIMTDSCCDLPREYIENNNIPFVSLTCRLDNKEYKDDFGLSLTYKDFYDLMRKGLMPKTSQPNPKDFYELFKNAADSNENIIYICVSSGLSGTFNSATIAKNMIKDEYKDIKIKIVDTLTASLGQGLLVIKAVKMKAQGASYDEVVEYLEENKLSLNTYITVNDLSYLRKGGRISANKALLGIVLHIKPVLAINDQGKVIPVFKIRGRRKVINKLAEYVLHRIKNPENQIITICHGDAEDEAIKLKQLILEKIKVKNVVINYIGPVVGTYGGAGALAVFFMGKYRQNHILL